jgi:hypothetical protein
MRKLFCISIIHTPEDMGSHLTEVKKQYIARYGISKWEERVDAVQRFWQELSKLLLNIPVDYKKVKLYQDSLPVCDHELDIVKSLAQNGNSNYQLLLELVNKGATIVGTEDPKLLIAERERLNRMGIIISTNSYDELIDQRDKYIAERIGVTLKESETGFLFIGALHKVVGRLPEDIRTYESINDIREENLNE